MSIEIPTVERNQLSAIWEGVTSRKTLAELEAIIPQQIEDQEVDGIKREYVIVKPNHVGAEWRLMARLI